MHTCLPGDHALKALHVHVWLTTSFRHPQPGTRTASLWALGHPSWDMIRSEAVPWSTA
jgi:hypothetical protein